MAIGQLCMYKPDKSMKWMRTWVLGCVSPPGVCLARWLCSLAFGKTGWQTQMPGLVQGARDMSITDAFWNKHKCVLTDGTYQRHKTAG